MKNKKVLKRLISVLPLVGIISPLASCGANTTVASPKQAAYSNTNEWRECLIKITRLDHMLIGATDKLYLPTSEEQTLEEQTINFICEDASLTITDIQSINVHKKDGTYFELIEEKDYRIEFDNEGKGQVVFTTTFLNNAKTWDVEYIRINPLKVTKFKREIKIDTPYVKLESEPSYCPLNGTRDIHISIADGSNYEFYYDEDAVEASIGGHNVVAKQRGTSTATYIDIEIKATTYDEIDKDSPLVFTYLPIKPISELQYSASFSFEEKPTNEEKFKQYKFLTLSKCIGIDDTNFQLVVPASKIHDHHKKISKALWFFESDTETEHECKIEKEENGDYIISSSQEVTKGTFNEGISITVFVEPIGRAEFAGDGSFENDTWNDLKYWLSFGQGCSDTVQGENLAKIYGLGNVNDFVGKKRKITWDKQEHDVMVVSTFSLPIVEEHALGYTLLSDDDIDFDHRAALTFQFTNLLTNSKGEIVKKIFTKDNLAIQDNINRNCWEFWDEDDIDHHSSQLRQYLRDNKKGHFQRYLDKTVKEMTVHTATPHYTKRPDPIKTQYVNDVYFIPTAQQLGAKSGDFIPFESGEGGEEFQYYAKQGEPTNGKTGARVFLKVGGDWEDAEEYWLSSPTDSHHMGQPRHDVYGCVDGSLNHCWMTDEHALIPCFSIDNYYW